MRRGIGRLRAGGGGFSPISVFAGSAAGLWLDPSDTSTGFQDSAGTTPQTATGQPTGKRLDKSGRSNSVIQATSTARPTYTVAGAIAWDNTDAVDDNYAVPTFIAGTLTAGMDVFLAVKRTGKNVPVYNLAGSGAKYVLYMDPGGPSSTMDGVGASWNALVNGVQVGTTGSATAVQMDAAVPTGTWCVLEAQNVDLSLWTGLGLAGYTGNLLLGGVGGLIVCPSQSAGIRASLRTWLGAKVGLTL